MFAHFEQVVRKAMVSSVDEAVGNIIEALEATGAVHLAIVNALTREMTITLAIWQHKWQYSSSFIRTQTQSEKTTNN